MSDDDKKKPGLFDPELANQILRAALEGKPLDVPEESAEEKPAPTRPPKKHKSSGKSAQRPPREVAPRVEAPVALSPEDEKLLDGFYWKLLKKYEARKFFTEKFTSHDLSELMDLLMNTLPAEDRQKLLAASKNDFSPVKFWEDHLYVYENFEEALVGNDFERAGLQGEEKVKYEEQLLALGKFLERQKEFIKTSNIPSYINRQHQRSLRSLDFTWRSLYLNNDERLARVIPNTLLRQFWFDDSSDREKNSFLTKGQKVEFAQNVDVFSGDWRRLANYTVNWEVEQLKQKVHYLTEKTEKNEFFKKFPKDLERIEQLVGQIIFDVKFEADTALSRGGDLKDAERFLEKWLASGSKNKNIKSGLLIQIYKKIDWFIGLKKKKLTDKKWQDAKDSLLLFLVKMEADLLRATDIKEAPQSPEDILSAELARPSEVPMESPTEEELATEEAPEDKPLPPFQPTAALRRFMEEEAAARETEYSSAQEPPAEEVKTEQKEEHQISINEYNFLKNVLSDKSLSDVLTGEIFDQIKALPKVVYKQDLPSVDKVVFDDAWKQVAEVLNQQVNEWLNKFEESDYDLINKYLLTLGAQLRVEGITTGYDPVYDLDSLKKRLALYGVLKIVWDIKPEKL